MSQGALLVDMNTGHCFRLNRVGAEVWRLLEAGPSLREIVATVAASHGQPLDQVDTDVRSLFSDLAREGLLAGPESE